MLGELQLSEHVLGIGREDFLSRLAVEKREDQRHQALDDMGVAVTLEEKPRLAVAADDPTGLEPDLARATAHLVRLALRALRQGLEAAAKVDEIAIAIVPIVEELEIGKNVVDRLRHELWSSMLAHGI